MISSIKVSQYCLKCKHQQKEKVMERLLTVDELSEHLRVPKSWVYHRTRQRGPNSIPMVRCSKYCRFNLEDVMAWLEKQNPQNENPI
jgi:excisionase family DNA binding protein